MVKNGQGLLDHDTLKFALSQDDLINWADFCMLILIPES